jgi:hypothetical protein
MADKPEAVTNKTPVPDIPKQTPPAAAASDTRVQSTALFRALNFELFVKPNVVVMGIGIASITACVAYIAYWNSTAENRKNDYMALNEKGNLEKRKRTSKWD